MAMSTSGGLCPASVIESSTWEAFLFCIFFPFLSLSLYRLGQSFDAVGFFECVAGASGHRDQGYQYEGDGHCMIPFVREMAGTISLCPCSHVLSVIILKY